MLLVIKGGHEHQKRAFGKVEIGNECVYRLEFVAGVNKDPGVTFHRGDGSVLLCYTFYGAARGCAYTDQPSARTLALIDQARAFRRNGEKLGVHHVIGDIFFLDGTKRAKPDVKHHRSNGNSLFSDLIKKLGCKVKSRGRSCGRAFLSCIDRLVTVLVLQPLRNIRRQWHHSNLMQDLVNVCIALTVIGKTDDAVSLLDHVNDLSVKLSLAKLQLHSDARALSWLYQALPRVGFSLSQKEKLDQSLLSSAHVSVNTRGDDLGIIDHQDEYFEWVDTPEEADVILTFIQSPISDGYNKADRENGGNGYMPITLQYRPYTATNARSCSIAGGDPREVSNNRSYQGKTNTAANASDLDLVCNAKAQFPDKPVVVVLRMQNPMVMAELEPSADAILVDFGVTQEAICELLSGAAEPQGLLPVQLPKDMDEVETHFEDAPLDMKPYTDSCGHSYDFGFGLNWEGVITDSRKIRYIAD